MLESTDPRLAGRCARCGEFYTRRPNPDWPWYCSPGCRYAQGRSGRGHGPSDGGPSSGCVAPSLGTRSANERPLKTDRAPDFLRR